MIDTILSLRAFIEEENGQGITEYGAILAFVGVLIAVMYAFGHTTMFPGGNLQFTLRWIFATVTLKVSRLVGLSS